MSTSIVWFNDVFCCSDDPKSRLSSVISNETNWLYFVIVWINVFICWHVNPPWAVVPVDGISVLGFVESTSHEIWINLSLPINRRTSSLGSSLVNWDVEIQRILYFDMTYK